MIKCGDCIELMSQIPDGSVDMVLCDPPYGITRNEWDTPLPWDKFWAETYRVCKYNAAILMFSLSNFSFDLIATNRKDWRYKLIWVKNSPTGFLNANRMPLRGFEEINVFYRRLPTYNPVKSFGHKPYYVKANGLSPTYDGFGLISSINEDGSRYPTDVIEFPVQPNRMKVHPTEKPVGLLEYLIKTYTNEGETVLDPTMGVGSTGEAALNLGRKFIGLEKNPDFFEVACGRISPGVA